MTVPGRRLPVSIAATVLMATALSCTGVTPERSGAARPAGEGTASEVAVAMTPPPAVTGSVVLEDVGIFGGAAAFRTPWGLSFGVDGTLYVCDRDRARIVRLGTDGAVLSTFSGFSSRIERLYAPVDVTSSGGIPVYAVDAAGAAVLRFDRNLRNAYIIYRRNPEEARLFGTFAGLAYDADSGDLYIADQDAGAILRLDMLGGVMERGTFGAGAKPLREPAGLAVGQDGAVYVADAGIGAVGVFANYSAPVRFIGGDVLEAPVDVAVLPDGLLAVADARGIVVMDAKGTALGRAGFGEGRDLSPRGVAYRDGRLYVSDLAARAVVVYTVTVRE